MCDLIVKATQHIFGRPRVVILNELYPSTPRSIESALVEALQKEPSRISEHFRLYDQYIRNSGWNDLHGIKYSLSIAGAYTVHNHSLPMAVLILRTVPRQ